MSYIYIDDRFAQHPKVAALSNRAFRAHVLALCYCGAHLTNGDITLAAARTLGVSQAIAGELVTGGLWEQNEKGWKIHDYLDWQDSRDEVLARREKNRTAGKIRARGAKRDAAGRLTGASTAEASASLDGTLGIAGPASPAEDPASPAPTPSPREASSPEVRNEREGLPGRLRSAFEALGCSDELLMRRLAKDLALAVIVEKLEQLATKPGRVGASPRERIVGWLRSAEDTLEPERQRVREAQFSALPIEQQLREMEERMAVPV